MVKKEKSFHDLTRLAIDAALSAGAILREGFGRKCSIQHKEGVHNLVTEYDYKSEKTIIDFLSKHAPGSQFLAEESGKSGKTSAPLLWIIDPLDGTVNFAHRLPMFAVSIGLEKEGKLFCGVVYHPITQELFIAERGVGAFLGEERLAVSPTKKLKDSILTTGFPYNLAENPYHCIEHFVDLLQAGIPIRRFGAAAIDFAYVAAGRFDGFLEVSLAAWDCAAGQLLIEEAGGTLSGWDGTPFDLRSKAPVLATNGHIHTQVLKLLELG